MQENSKVDLYWPAFSHWRGEEAALKEKYFLKSALLLANYVDDKAIDPAKIDKDLTDAPLGLFNDLDQFKGRSFGMVLFGKLNLSRYLEKLESTSEEYIPIKQLEAVITEIYVKPRENPKQAIAQLMDSLQKWLAIKSESYKDKEETKKLCCVIYLLLKIVMATVDNLGFGTKKMTSYLISLDELTKNSANVLQLLKEKWQLLSSLAQEKVANIEVVQLIIPHQQKEQEDLFARLQKRYGDIAKQKSTQPGKIAALHKVLIQDRQIMDTIQSMQINKKKRQDELKKLKSLAQALIHHKLTMSEMKATYPQAFQILWQYSSVEVQKQLLPLGEKQSNSGLQSLLMYASSWFFNSAGDKAFSKLQLAIRLCMIRLNAEEKAFDDEIRHLVIKIFPDSGINQNKAATWPEHELNELLKINQTLQDVCLLFQRIMEFDASLSQLHLSEQSQLFICSEMPAKDKLNDVFTRLMDLFTEKAKREDVLTMKSTLQPLFVRLKIGLELVTVGHSSTETSQLETSGSYFSPL